MTDYPWPRTLYIQGERRLDFTGWLVAIQKAAASLGDTLSEQQLGDSDIPVIVYRCVDYITQCGETRPCVTGPAPQGLDLLPRGQFLPSKDPSESSCEAPLPDQCLGPLSLPQPLLGPAPSSAPLLSRPDFGGHLPQVWADVEDPEAAGEP